MKTEIGTLLVSNPDLRHGRPCIVGTGITVHRIAVWYKLGNSPEEIARRYGHLAEAQVHAALTYYHANRDDVEAELAADEAEAERVEEDYRQAEQTA